MPKHKKKKHHNVSYHGLHNPHVLRHVWVHHDWFENCVPRVDEHESAPEPDSDDTDSPADNPATI